MSLTLLLGGARAGKSSIAVEAAAAWTGPIAVIVTAEIRDEEMAERIRRHRAKRPSNWETVEEPHGKGRPVELQESLIAFDPFVAPRGESTRQLTERVLHFLASLPEGDHLLFTHGGVTRAICGRAGEDIRVEPGGLVRIDRDSRGFFALLVQPCTENASP